MKMSIILLINFLIFISSNTYTQDYAKILFVKGNVYVLINKNWTRAYPGLNISIYTYLNVAPNAAIKISYKQKSLTIKNNVIIQVKKAFTSNYLIHQNSLSNHVNRSFIKSSSGVAQIAGIRADKTVKTKSPSDTNGLSWSDDDDDNEKSPTKLAENKFQSASEKYIQKKFLSAINDLKPVVENLGPNKEKGYFLLGLSYFQICQYNLSDFYFSKVISLKGSLLNKAIILKGLSLHYTEKYYQSNKYLKLFLKKESTNDRELNAGCYFTLALNSVAQKKYSSAKKYYNIIKTKYSDTSYYELSLEELKKLEKL